MDAMVDLASRIPSFFLATGRQFRDDHPRTKGYRWLVEDSAFQIPCEFLQFRQEKGRNIHWESS